MRTASSLLAGLLLLLLAVPGLVQAQTSRTVTETAQLRPDGEVVVDTYSGRIDVSTWDRSSVHVEARIEDSDPDLVERTQILVEGRGDRVTIADEVEKDSGGFLSRVFGFSSGDHPSVYYTIRVPRRARLVLNAYASAIDVRDAGGDVTIDTYSGDAQVRGLRGHLEADTYSGEVVVRGLDGSAAVDTYSGDADLVFERLTGGVAFDSYSGDLTMRLPRSAGFELVADLGMSGDFESDFPTSRFSVDGDVYRGTVGGGGPRIVFDTYSGDLRLLQR